MMQKFMSAQKKMEIYDIGKGLSLLNILTKNEEGKLDKINTYIGIEGNGFVQVGITEKLAEPGTIFSYSKYVRMIEANLDTYIQVFEGNVRMK